PCPGFGQIAQEEVDDVGDEHAGHDHRLVESGETAAQSRRSQLRHIGGDERAGRTDGQSEEDPHEYEEQRPARRRHRTEQRAEHEDDGGGEDHASPAEAVRELTGDGAAEDGAEHHSRGDPADHTRLVAQPPVVLEERQRAGHHADVIAEENSAERAEEVDERAGDLLVIVHDDNIPFWMDGQRISESRNRLHCRSSETQLCRSLQKVSANISVARNVNRTARGCQRYFSPACSGGCAVELRTNRTGGTADISGSWPPISAAAASSTRCPSVVKSWWTVVRAGLK